MSLRIRCPSCRTLNIVPNSSSVRKIDCVGCDRRFTLPDKDEDEAVQQGSKLKSKSAPADVDDEPEVDRPRRKKRKAAASEGSSTMLIIIGGVLIGVFVLCGVGGAFIYFAMRSVGGAIERVADADRKRRGNNQDFNVVAKGKVVFSHSGILTVNDPPDPTPELVDVNARMQVHQVKLQPDKTYVVTLNSRIFDPYLRVESPQGEQLFEDDDSGGELNARIVFRPRQAGNYRIIVTAWDGRVGPYDLRVQEAE